MKRTIWAFICLLLFSGCVSVDQDEKFSVSFDKNASDAIGVMADQIIIDGKSQNLNDCEYSRPGYSFAGWSLSPTGNIAYLNQGSITLNGSNVVLYAQWSIKQYTVIFDTLGGSSVAAQSVDYGDHLVKPQDPVKAGYSFAGWYTNMSFNFPWDFTNYTVMDSMTMYAHWDPNEYAVTFNKNASDATGSMSAQMIVCGESEPLKLCGFTREGYTFIGWAETAGGSVKFTNSESYTMGITNTVLYACWEGNDYSITFNKNAADAAGTMAQQTVKCGETASLSTCSFSRSGYAFIGWAETGTGQVKYTNGAAFTMGKENITLYARWGYYFSSGYREMVQVPGGTYQQTNAAADQFFQHTVSFFNIGKYEVTYALWSEVRSWALNNGYSFAAGYPGSGSGNSDLHPVTSVNWRDAVVWCNAYSEMSGFVPVYYQDNLYNLPLKTKDNSSPADSTPGSVDNPFVLWSANGYRLPTEGEWQYAAAYRDGSSWTPYYYASGATNGHTNEAATSAVAWYDCDTDRGTREVGAVTSPNQLGVYDMSGNILEYCWDWKATWPSGSQTDYRGPATQQSWRILRGGHFNPFNLERLQIGYKAGGTEPWNNGGGTEGGNYGFRVVRVP